MEEGSKRRRKDGVQEWGMRSAGRRMRPLRIDGDQEKRDVPQDEDSWQ